MTWSPENNTTPWQLLTVKQRESLKSGSLVYYCYDKDIWLPIDNSCIFGADVVRRVERPQLLWGDIIYVDDVLAIALEAGDDWFYYIVKDERHIRRGYFKDKKVVKL